MRGKYLLIGVLSALAVCGLPAVAQKILPVPPEKAAIQVKLAHPEIPRMSAKELVRMLKKKTDLVILDTQPPDGYEMWHIPSAINIPYISTADPMDRQLKLMALPSDRQIVIYCLCEEGTDSAQVAMELKQLGYNKQNIRILEGGLVLWDAAGHPMVKIKIPM
jgi:rhodanese-related sulfurtransferase